MRRTAYLKALEEANQLPEDIPELSRYFNNGYNPRLQAISEIKQAARLDVNALFDGELVEILNWPESQSVEYRLHKLVKGAEEFLRQVSYEEWKGCAESVTAKMTNSSALSSIQLGTMPFAEFNQLVKEMSSAENHTN